MRTRLPVSEDRDTETERQGVQRRRGVAAQVRGAHCTRTAAVPVAARKCTGGLHQTVALHTFVLASVTILAPFVVGVWSQGFSRGVQENRASALLPSGEPLPCVGAQATRPQATLLCMGDGAPASSSTAELPPRVERWRGSRTEHGAGRSGGRRGLYRRESWSKVDGSELASRILAAAQPYLAPVDAVDRGDLLAKRAASFEKRRRPPPPPQTVTTTADRGEAGLSAPAALVPSVLASAVTASAPTTAAAVAVDATDDADADPAGFHQLPGSTSAGGTVVGASAGACAESMPSVSPSSPPTKRADAANGESRGGICFKRSSKDNRAGQ